MSCKLSIFLGKSAIITSFISSFVSSFVSSGKSVAITSFVSSFVFRMGFYPAILIGFRGFFVKVFILLKISSKSIFDESPKSSITPKTYSYDLQSVLFTPLCRLPVFSLVYLLSNNYNSLP